jgi:glucokinase
MSRYLGVDLGGTGTRIVAIDGEGRLLSNLTTPTDRQVRGSDAVAGLIVALAEVAGGDSIGGIGIGASGPVDAAGVIRNPATLPAYSAILVTTMVAMSSACRVSDGAR